MLVCASPTGDDAGPPASLRATVGGHLRRRPVAVPRMFLGREHPPGPVVQRPVPAGIPISIGFSPDPPPGSAGHGPDRALAATGGDRSAHAAPRVPSPASPPTPPAVARGETRVDRPPPRAFCLVFHAAEGSGRSRKGCADAQRRGEIAARCDPVRHGHRSVTEKLAQHAPHGGFPLKILRFSAERFDDPRPART